MAKINRFEEIQAWKKARELTRAIYEATKVDPFPKDFAQSYLPREKFDNLYSLAEETSRLIQGFSNYLQQKPIIKSQELRPQTHGS